MNQQDELKKIVSAHVSRLRQLSKEADDFASRLSTHASELEDAFRTILESKEEKES